MRFMWYVTRALARGLWGDSRPGRGTPAASPGRRPDPAAERPDGALDGRPAGTASGGTDAHAGRA
ncbi:hypothetical protein AB0L25_33915 [Spirillospora sp. NPDC052242]